MDITTDSIHLVLADLIEKKSERDNIRFTLSQLANAIDVKRSIIHRIMHPDPTKRVTNPHIQTLIKIIDYFRSDGFDITMDSLLGKNFQREYVQEQVVNISNNPISIPLYSLEHTQNICLGTVELSLNDYDGIVIAFISSKDLMPMFKKGSIFIVAPSLKPENNSLIALKVKNSPQILIGKFFIDNGNKTFESLSESAETIILNLDLQSEILGVVIQVNAKT